MTWGISKKRKLSIYRKNPFCNYCGCKMGMSYGKDNFCTWDHKISLQNGGTNSVENVFLACFQCNNLKQFLNYDHFVFLLDLMGKDGLINLQKSYRKYYAKALQKLLVSALFLMEKDLTR